MYNTLSVANDILYWASRSPTNASKIEEWYDAAVESIAEGKGAQMISGSGNGMSFAAQLAMTHVQWMQVLRKVLEALEDSNSVIQNSGWATGGYR